MTQRWIDLGDAALILGVSEDQARLLLLRNLVPMHVTKAEVLKATARYLEGVEQPPGALRWSARAVEELAKLRALCRQS